MHSSYTLFNFILMSATIVDSVVDSPILTHCVGCGVAFVIDPSPSTLCRATCPLSSSVYASMAHDTCHAVRVFEYDRIASLPVFSNFLPVWMSEPHRQHPLVVDQFKQLRKRWMYDATGQNKDAFAILTSAQEQDKFRLDQVGSSSHETPSASLPCEPFTMIIPLLMPVTEDGKHARPSRPQLWVSPATLPLDEFRLMFTFTFSCEFKANLNEVRKLQESMRGVRDVLSSLDIVLPPSTVEGRYWLQEGRQNEYFVVGVVTPIESVIVAAYAQCIGSPPAGRRMSWFHWNEHIDGELKNQRSACERTFTSVMYAIRQCMKNTKSIDVSLIATIPAIAPVSHIRIDVQTRTPNIRYNCNATSKDSWWVFPPVDQTENAFPMMYECDDTRLSSHDMLSKWYQWGALPLIYDTERFRRVYKSFPLIRQNEYPVGVALHVRHKQA